MEDDSLKVAVSDPFDIETIEKLRFILNRKVETALAPREAILEAINRYYGQVEGENADSMFQEFTDTAIDFTETEERAGHLRRRRRKHAPVVRLVQVMIQEACSCGPRTSISNRLKTVFASGIASTAC